MTLGRLLRLIVSAYWRGPTSTRCPRLFLGRRNVCAEFRLARRHYRRSRARRLKYAIKLKRTMNNRPRDATRMEVRVDRIRAYQDLSGGKLLPAITFV